MKAIPIGLGEENNRNALHARVAEVFKEQDDARREYLAKALDRNRCTVCGKRLTDYQHNRKMVNCFKHTPRKVRRAA